MAAPAMVSAAGIMYLATDQNFNAAKLSNSHGKFLNYLNQHVGGGGRESVGRRASGFLR